MRAIAAAANLQRVPLTCRLTPQDVLLALADDPFPFALTGDWAGGGAIVGSSPVAVADQAADPFALLDVLPDVGEQAGPGEAVGGGWFGWLGYRLGRRVEDLPEGPRRPVPLAEFHLAYYDHVLHLDRSGRWWFEALVGAGTDDRIARRLDDLRALLAEPKRSRPPYAAPPPLRLSHTDMGSHMAAIHECRERIFAGEIYQANICLRLETRWDGPITEIYARALDQIWPARGGAFQTPWGGIASLSPELFLRRAGDDVVTAPIKGTVKRPADERMAQQALAALRRSVKDAAEHVMIVDLMRNDLGRVCAYGTIVAPRFPDAEPHPGVWHLVSKVRGRLRPGVGNEELLYATFPPGSVTGRRRSSRCASSPSWSRPGERSTRARSASRARWQGSSSTSPSAPSSSWAAACGWALEVGSSPVLMPSTSLRRLSSRRARLPPRSAPGSTKRRGTADSKLRQAPPQLDGVACHDIGSRQCLARKRPGGHRHAPDPVCPGAGDVPRRIADHDGLATGVRRACGSGASPGDPRQGRAILRV
jgi:para-aminobenzoate synthetase/4-amino-4-deoxychorismate lyase